MGTKSGEAGRIFPNGRNEADNVNNAERIRANAGPGDVFTAYVEATDLETNTQKYSLVVTGCFAGRNIIATPSDTNGATTSRRTTTTTLVQRKRSAPQDAKRK